MVWHLTCLGIFSARENTNAQLDLGGEGENSEYADSVERDGGNDFDEVSKQEWQVGLEREAEGGMEESVGGAGSAAWEQSQQSGGMESGGSGEEQTEDRIKIHFLGFKQSPEILLNISKILNIFLRPFSF